jgi:hypothetical protein
MAIASLTATRPDYSRGTARARKLQISRPKAESLL